MKKTSRRRDNLGLGILLLALGAALIFGKPSKILDLSKYTFAEEPVEVVGFESVQVSPADEPKRIIIPSLEIDLAVKRARVVNGYWEVFEKEAGWGDGSGIPGSKGNQVIFAHARPGIFASLKDIKEGMSIYVLTEGRWYEYQTVEIKDVYPNQVEVIKPTEDERLTLYTCLGFADRKRLIVVAKPK